MSERNDKFDEDTGVCTAHGILSCDMCLFPPHSLKRTAVFLEQVASMAGPMSGSAMEHARYLHTQASSSTRRTFAEWLTGMQGAYPEVNLTRTRNLLQQAWDYASLPTSATTRAEPTEQEVELAAMVIAESPLIDAPKLPAPSWMGLARLVLKAGLFVRHAQSRSQSDIKHEERS